MDVSSGGARLKTQGGLTNFFLLRTTHWRGGSAAWPGLATGDGGLDTWKLKP
jgi:hypothetical protein